jgi:maltooligosyltrehalose trehalohydrolase
MRRGVLIHQGVGGDSGWRPSLGAFADGGGVSFRVWAPTRNRVDLVLDPLGTAPRCERLERSGDDTFAGTFDTVRAGDLYMYLLDGEGPYPDPCSRFQPQGVHGPSAVVDPSEFEWSDHGWQGVPLERAIIYELHVGTFTPAATFSGVTERLPYLAELGVTAIELMPVADFPGSRNWGYDGVCLFAPCRQYGTPDELRRLVDTSHRAGLAVLLDVVYNHFGPDGSYCTLFSPAYRSPRHQSPWGAAINVNGDSSGPVRAFFIENALHWLHEYHVDGLRLDATHWLLDDSTPHLVAELATRVRESVTGRTVLLVAEDERNLATVVRHPQEDGWGLDAVWADDFHHHVRRRSAGDRDGYYQDYSGSIADLAATLRQGWFYCGQHSAYAGAPRGTSPVGVPLERMIFCLQNHDQVGNRPFGRRLHHQIDPALFRALSALLFFAPETPLLFMGQEWAASSPFLFFTDHHQELGRLVTEGRRREFSRFQAFADEERRARIPDPQAVSTFEASRLNWEEQALAPHAGILELYRSLLGLRRREPALQPGSRTDVIELDDHGLAVVRNHAQGEAILLVSWLRESGGEYDSRRHGPIVPAARWSLVLSTDEPRFQESPGEERAMFAPEIELEESPVMRFHRPSTVILRRR